MNTQFMTQKMQCLQATRGTDYRTDHERNTSRPKILGHYPATASCNHASPKTMLGQTTRQLKNHTLRPASVESPKYLRDQWL
jgi:hypothetical protein